MLQDSRIPPKRHADGETVSPGVSKPTSPVPDSIPANDVDLSSESVAGEEDPGAALDLLWPAPPA
ncbi:hypothetical protein [Polaromonas sp.]|uniref:hypothetical protein n=1 Tax=Polaromonas sp. TaxID=1869339 RepID=UPI003CAD2FD6